MFHSNPVYRSEGGGVPLRWVPHALIKRLASLCIFTVGDIFLDPQRWVLPWWPELAARVGRKACLLVYQRVHEYPFPAMLHDAEAAYQALLDLGYAPAAIVVGGESAGAGLELGLLYSLLPWRATPTAGLFRFRHLRR